MNRPLEIATPTHAWAVSVYVLQAVLGVLYVVGIAEASTLTSITSEAFTGVWAVILVGGGVLATIVVFMARKPQYTLPALKIELLANMAIGVTSLIYEASLIVGNGPLGVATTQAYAITFVVGSAARSIQIRRERGRVINALSSPTIVTEVIADEKDK